ncbi:MAG: SoxR reducing system RseC family protein [candidate division WOR-3 bacterium]|nr:SoxR reducing system RseC family protein [candidate division WOR-3 bacterium]
MQEIGKIIEITGDIARIEITPSGGCVHCSQFKLCNPFGENKKVIELKNTLDAKIGDTVKIEIPEKAQALSIGLVFGLPVVLFMLGLVIGNYYRNEKLGAIFGGCGFALAIGILKIVDNRLRKKGAHLAKLKEIVKEENAGVG